jgi:hypothetical protein|tara:strand:- start:38 stop:400 length:363 start_codon:yes stop_codon:yes gene_type:complete
MNKKPIEETITEFLLRGEKEERFLISDVATHGCSGGTISDLIYYEDTVKFYNEHEYEIWHELSELAEDLGETIPFMISNFKGCKNVSDPKTFKNLLAWWICEHIATRISNEREDGTRSVA